MDSSHKMEMDALKEMCRIKGLRPTKVNGTNVVQISKGNNPRLSPISWEEFEDYLKSRHLAVYSKLGFIKIMRDDLE